MRRKSLDVLSEIKSAVDKGDYGKALSLIEENMANLFSSRNIKHFIMLLASIPEDRFTTPMQKLMLGWISFFCGNSGRMSEILADIVPDSLARPVENSIFYSLKAVSTLMDSHEEALRLAKASVEVMGNDPDSFHAATARLIYGQILFGAGEHRKAAHEFFAAYNIFKKRRSYIPAVTALVNYGLNKHALGEIADTVTLFQNEFAACGRYDCAFQMLKFPLGLAYFEMNRQKRAIRYLESIRDLMYSLNFVNLYGVLEMYLVYAYAICGLYNMAYRLIDELAGRLAVLNFEHINTLCAALRAHVNLLEGVPVSDGDIKLLEADYRAHGRNTPIGTLLILARLKLNGYFDGFSMNDLIALQESPDTTRNIPFMQTTCILAAEYYYQMREMGYCSEYLEKAVEIYTNYRLSARFLLERAECLSLLREMNRDLYRLVRRNMKNTSMALTAREIEILSLMAQGLSNSQISSRLCIGASTTKWHIDNILAKLRVRRRSQAVAQARKLGLLP